ncbi:spore protein alpha/beta [Desulfotomaculum copahuensis]|uniref:Spore protein alpha/beta n=1 Tax=Desulfotomaculum copahuensis TaxID=1838280 RepID=A0A1B7LCN9_9FIRM|nr:spore protein alpha/beta [Desulfotomaculum copahuensis]OAT80440.1 spore protein alpha/beta [Desulfotomaculum copahuensis]
MSHKKENDQLRTERQLDYLKWETARELGQDDLSNAESQLGLEETGWTDSAETRSLSKEAEEALAEEGGHKAERNLHDRL